MAKQLPIPTPGELRRRYSSLQADELAERIASLLHTDPPVDPGGLETEPLAEHPGLERLIFLDEAEVARRRRIWHRANRRTRLAEQLSRGIVYAPERGKKQLETLRHRIAHRTQLPLLRRDIAGELARCVRLHLKSDYINYTGESTGYEAWLSAERADGRRIELGELAVRTTSERAEQALKAWREEGVDRARWSSEVELLVPAPALTQRIVAEAVARFLIDTLAWQRGCAAMMTGAWPMLVFDDEWQEDSDNPSAGNVCEASLELLGQSTELLRELREIGIAVPELSAGERVAEVDYQNPDPRHYRHGVVIERALAGDREGGAGESRRWHVAFDDGVVDEVWEGLLVVFNRPPLVTEVIEGRVDLAARMRAWTAGSRSSPKG